MKLPDETSSLGGEQWVADFVAILLVIGFIIAGIDTIFTLAYS